MRKELLATCAAAAALLLGGCDTPQPRNEQSGAIIGAVAGGLLGAQVGGGSGRTAATIAGTIVGALVGGNIGRSMDQADRQRTALALETSRTGAPTYWRNPDNGNQYTVVPTQTVQTPKGPCRDYTVDAVMGGRVEKVHGTACRQPDGTWRTS
jgi:surface antigen